MNRKAEFNTEKRRKQLLDEMRILYSSTYTPPAIHPRYGFAYEQLYEKDSKEKGGSFEIRVFLCMLILAIFFTIEKNDTFADQYNTDEVIKCISTNMEILELFDE